MRTLGFILAILVGLVCWALTLVLSDGVAPLGNVGSAEAITFFTPIVLFALPLAVLAIARGHSLAGLWIVATAPVLAAVNFALNLWLIARSPSTSGPAGEKLSTFALVWCVLLLVVLAVAAVGKRRRQADQKA